MADQLLSWLQQAGFKGPALKTAWAIARRESGGRPTAYNPDRSTGDQSYGLFQINMLGKMGPDRRARFGISSNEQLLDPLTNAKAAYQMSKGGTDFGPWGIGPHAYRQMPALDTSGFPGVEPLVDRGQGLNAQTLPFRGQAPSMQTLPFRGQAPPARTLSSGFTLPDLNLKMPSLVPEAGPAAGFAPLKLTPPPTFGPLGGQLSAGPTKPLPPPPGGSVNVSAWTGQGTHVTSGLDLNEGRKTAVDIMAKPGTAVPAPADGVVLRLGSAQGGDSVYFKDVNGYVWWLGHVDSRYSLPQGTRVRAGQVLTRISADHAAPHLHLDRTLTPTDRFG